MAQGGAEDRSAGASPVSSGAYSLANRVLQAAIFVGALAILGRVLRPADFGTFAIVLAAQALFVPLQDFGLTPAYIKLKQADGRAQNAFFTLNVALGGVNLLFLAAAAPLLGLYFGMPVLVPLTLAYAASVMIRAFSQQGIASLARAKRFDAYMVVNLASELAGVVAAVAGALAGLGVWALVLRPLAASAVRYLAIAVAVRARYRLVGWRALQGFSQSFRFAIEVVVARLVSGALFASDRLIFGAYFAIDLLGHYSVAMNLARAPDSNIRNALSTPAIAHLARQVPTQRVRRYQIACNVMFIVAALPCVVLIVLGDLLVPWLMGGQWIDAGIYAQLLGLWGVGKILHGIATTLHINEEQMRQWTKQVGLAVPCILAPAVISAQLGYGPTVFVTALAGANLVYWLAAALAALYRFSRQASLALRFGWTVFLIIAVALPLGLWLKELMLANWTATLFGGTTQLLLLASAVLVVALGVQVTLNFRQMFDILAFIRKRL